MRPVRFGNAHGGCHPVRARRPLVPIRPMPARMAGRSTSETVPVPRRGRRRSVPGGRTCDEPDQVRCPISPARGADLPARRSADSPVPGVTRSAMATRSTFARSAPCPPRRMKSASLTASRPTALRNGADVLPYDQCDRYRRGGRCRASRRRGGDPCCAKRRDPVHRCVAAQLEGSRPRRGRRAQEAALPKDPLLRNLGFGDAGRFRPRTALSRPAECEPARWPRHENVAWVSPRVHGRSSVTTEFSRDLQDIAGFYKLAQYNAVRLVTPG